MKKTRGAEDPSRLTIVALCMLACSLMLLNTPSAAEKKAQVRPPQHPVAQHGATKERLVRVFYLPKKKHAPSHVSHDRSGRLHTPGTSQGHTPAIDASFTMPTLQYVRMLEIRTGARLILFDTLQHRILGSIASGRFDATQIDMHGMSLRAGNITNDLPASFRNKVLAEAGNPEHPCKFLVVLPSKSEAEFMRTLSDRLGEHGIPWKKVAVIRLQYDTSGDHIIAHIQDASVDGKTLPIETSVPLW